MNSLKINEAFSALLEEKFHGKKNVVNLLSELLDMDKKSIYRRLNSEVLFTFAEVSLLSQQLGISVDNFIGHLYPAGINNTTLALYGKPQDRKSHVGVIGEIRNYLALIASQPYSEMGNLTNYFPIFFHLENKEIYSLYLYHLNYMRGDNKTFGEFREEEETRMLVEAAHELSELFWQMDHYKIIMGRDPVRLLMQDVAYVKNQDLITATEYDNIKKEIRAMIAKLEEIIESGASDEGESPYNIYLSDTIIDLNCFYTWSETYSMSIAQLYMFGKVCSYETEQNANVKQWLDKWKNNSVKISGTGRSERTAFLAEQRRVLDSY